MQIVELPFLSLFTEDVVDNFSGKPKFLQVADFVLQAIDAGRIKKGQRLPSIYELSSRLNIAKDTAQKAYEKLKNIGVLSSHRGKGFFVVRDNFSKPMKIALFFNMLSEHKRVIYDAFIQELGPNIVVDFFIFNNDHNLFTKMLSSKLNQYSHYVLIPHFLNKFANTADIINRIPKDKLIILDNLPGDVEGTYGAVYEHFENDIYEALSNALTRLKKYHTLNLVVPCNDYFPRDISRGFLRFSQHNGFKTNMLTSKCVAVIKKGEVFIILSEEDLMKIGEKVLYSDFKLGHDVGIISYNETPVKKLLLNGLTTVSTDFRQMGINAARLILNKSTAQIRNPFYLNLRASL